MAANKCLVRWTYGPSTAIGKDILRESVRLFVKLYPGVDRVVCFNNVEKSDLNGVAKYADLLEQRAGDVGFSLAASEPGEEVANGCGWKLAPPRLAPDRHELFIDNDVVLRVAFPEIRDWMNRPDHTLISQGLGRFRCFGAFDAFIPPEAHYCAGLFGLPPNFDFASEIMKIMKTADFNRPLGGFDEQGLTTAIVVSQPYILVPNSKLVISEDANIGFDDLPDGIHFVGANRKEWHRGWKRYLALTNLALL